MCLGLVAPANAMAETVANRLHGGQARFAGFKTGTTYTAEARGNDVGVIATAEGWNLYVGGNGGALAKDLDDEALIRYIDRYFMYYIRTSPGPTAATPTGPRA